MWFMVAANLKINPVYDTKTIILFYYIASTVSAVIGYPRGQDGTISPTRFYPLYLARE